MIYNEMLWGELLTMEINDKYSIQQLMIGPGKEIHLLYHKKCDTNLIVLSGYGLIDKPNSFNQMQFETFGVKDNFYLEHNSPYSIINQSSSDNLIILKIIYCSGNSLNEMANNGEKFDTYYIEKDSDYPSRIVLADQFLF